MKKWFSKFTSVALLLVILLALTPQRAEAAGGSFEGSGAMWAGDRVTVTYYVNGSNLYGVDASLDYDGGTLEWLSVSQEIGGSWNLEHNGSSILLWDSKMSMPINGWTAVFSATFRVRDGVSPGSVVSASVYATASDGSSDISLGSAYWSADILAPLSGDADLDDLWCDNADLDFTGGTEYSITVPYSVSSLSLDWDRSHSGSSVSVYGNDLAVGSNTVTVEVTAENGNTKHYYIYVTREQDPNYVPSSDATLSALYVSSGQLSPAFNPNVTDYVVYLPYEISEFALAGTALDSKAFSVEQIGSSALLEGKNALGIKCTAEDKTTTKEYKVTVIRMPAYAGVLPEIISPNPAPVAPKPQPEPEPVLTWEIPTVLELPFVGEVAALWVAIAAGVLLLLLLILLLLLVWFAGKQKGAREAEKNGGLLPADPAPTAETPLGAAAAEAEEEPPVAEAPAEAPAAEAAAVEAAEDMTAEAVEVGEDPQQAESAPEAAPAEDVPVEDPSVEETPAEDPSTDEEKDVGRISLSELLDEIRGM